jgi:hypothetical protein
MGPQNPSSPEWAAYYAEHPEALASWREQNGYQPMSADCPKTGRSASVCEDPTHATCPDLRS